MNGPAGEAHGRETGAEVVARGRVEVCWREAAPRGPAALLDQAVDEVWGRAVCERGSELHDSPILVFRERETRGEVTVIHGEYLPYRYYYARGRLGERGPAVAPMGVNGFTLLNDGGGRYLVFGRRGPRVSWYPGLWECVPSGGLDRRCARPDGTVDFGAMLAEEFEEELCLPASTARIGGSFGIVYDRTTWTYDVCCRIEASCPRETVLEAVRRSGEYSEVRFVELDRLADTAREFGESLIPTARAMIELDFELAGVPFD
jgi:hypothetical protein